MSNINEINDEAEFNAAISSGVVLVDFWADWCGPCKMQTPILEQAAAELVENKVSVSIHKMNTDASSAITSKMKIQSIPCLIIFNDGKIVDTLIGLQRKDAIVKAITAVAI